MKISPSIKERKTEDLMGIIENPDDWQQHILESAKEELVKRGVPLKRQEFIKQITQKYKRKIKYIKNNASHSKFDLLLIMLFSPFLIRSHSIFNFLSPFEEEYKKKKKQERIFVILGMIMWFGVFYILFELNLL